MVSRFDNDDLTAFLSDVNAPRQINVMYDSSTSGVNNDTPLDRASTSCNAGEDDQMRFEEIQVEAT
jgi:hypothetical protein